MPEWDEALPDDLVKEWQKCIDSLIDLCKIPIPRRCVPCDPSQQWRYELHVFTDSSKDVVATEAYLCSYCDVGCHVHIAAKHIVMAGKTKVLSQSEIARGSIPRKEPRKVECLDSTSLKIENCELWTVIKWCSVS